MTTAMTPPTNPISAATLEKVLLDGNLAGLNSAQRVEYMQRVCETLGLNPLTKPFEFLTFQGKMVMYARRDCTEQLRKIHGVSVTISGREVVEGCYIVTARAQDAAGRHDESIGAVSIDGLKGEARSNAMMKAETKAKRRVTLSVCGLGMLDESETDSIPGAKPAPEYLPPANTNREAPQDRPKAAADTAVIHNAAASGPPSAPSSPPAAIPITTSPSKPRTAADVKATGGPCTPEQNKLIHVLKGQVGGVFSGDGSDPRDKWSKTLGVYRNEKGERCSHTNELSKDQASHLIERMQGYVAKQGARADEVPVIDIQPKPPTDPLAEMLERAFPEASEQGDWLHGLWDCYDLRELNADEKLTAGQLLIAMSQGDDFYDDALSKAREKGLCR